MSKSIWDLELHEIILMNNYQIQRVPNGWIYNYPRGPILVPYSDDLRPGGGHMGVKK